MTAPSGPNRVSRCRTTPEPTGNHSGTISEGSGSRRGRDPLKGSPGRTHLAAGTTRHGTRSTFERGCHCGECVDAERTRQRDKAQARRNAQPPSRYVEPWQRAELPDDADRRLYRREKAKAAKRHAKQLAPVLAAAKAELERQLTAGILTTRGGRKTRSAHLSHMAVEAASE